MATKKEVDLELEIALSEIGTIKPWYDRSVREWVFSHDLYPVEYAGESKQEVTENYPKYLREFIKHRINQKLEKRIERKTKGRGGARPGAGRPKGTSKKSTKVIRVDVRVAEWVEKHPSEILALSTGKKKLVSTTRR